MRIPGATSESVLGSKSVVVEKRIHGGKTFRKTLSVSCLQNGVNSPLLVLLGASWWRVVIGEEKMPRPYMQQSFSLLRGPVSLACALGCAPTEAQYWDFLSLPQSDPIPGVNTPASRLDHGTYTCRQLLKSDNQ